MSSSQSLLALACGDSYGSHYERDGLMGSKFRVNSLPNKPIFQNITDDTKMALILVKHYQKHKKLDITILKESYKKWAIKEGDRDGIGLHTKDVLVWSKSDKDSQGNGALMRNIPFGVQLIEDGYSFDKAVEMMNKDSTITHSNETIFLSNRLALDLAVNGVGVLKKDDYKKLLSSLKHGYSAWVIHTLYIVIEALKAKRKFLTAFKYIVSQGGDTDTNCAIFGAIYGYKNDISSELDVKEFVSLKTMDVRLHKMMSKKSYKENIYAK